MSDKKSGVGSAFNLVSELLKHLPRDIEPQEIQELLSRGPELRQYLGILEDTELAIEVFDLIREFLLAKGRLYSPRIHVDHLTNFNLPKIGGSQTRYFFPEETRKQYNQRSYKLAELIFLKVEEHDHSNAILGSMINTGRLDPSRALSLHDRLAILEQISSPEFISLFGRNSIIYFAKSMLECDQDGNQVFRTLPRLYLRDGVMKLNQERLGAFWNKTDGITRYILMHRKED